MTLFISVTLQQKESSNSQYGECDWQAARTSIKKEKHLDATGLTITGCRHGVAQQAVNVFYEEVYNYAHYVQIRDMIPRKVSFFWEDIVCKYWPWLTKKDPVTASAMKPALSVMHGKAHNWSWQVTRHADRVLWSKHLQFPVQLFLYSICSYLYSTYQKAQK